MNAYKIKAELPQTKGNLEDRDTERIILKKK
jgi:hypothetical protein